MLMKLNISNSNNEYISASEAGKKAGYTSDYIGQLCRGEKIPCKLVNKMWFVDLEVLVLHKKNHNLMKGRKPRLPLNSSYERDMRPILPTLSKQKKSIYLGILKYFKL